MKGTLAKEEKQETEGVKKIIAMPDYKIELPDEKLIKSMDIVKELVKSLSMT